MGSIAWNDAYLIGVPEIDTQHRQFCAIVNKLTWAQDKRYPRDVAYRLAFELLKYAEFHFVCEENLMLLYGYPGLDGQAREHKKLLEILTLKLHGLHRGDHDLETINKFAFMWFISHTSVEDKAFGEFMVKRGTTRVENPG
jgi:hemerythrin-like metal-binding protein